METKWTRGSRKHRVGRERSRYVMATTVGVPLVGGGTHGGDVVVWVGPDDRGLELEVIALRFSDELVVIHVMPTALRGGFR